MPELRAAEVVPKVIVREKIGATPATGSAEARAQKINQQIDQGNFQKAFEAGQRKSIDSAKIAEKASQFGTERDADGKKVRSPESELRHSSFKTGTEIAKTYLEGGVDAVTDPTVKAALRGSVLQEAKSNPLLANEMMGMSTAELNAFADRLLKDPQYAGRVGERLSANLNKEFINENDINNAQDELQEQKYKQQDKEDEIADIDRRRKAIDTQLDAFKRTRGGRIGAKAAELDNLRGNLPTMQAELATARKELKTSNEKLEDLKQERAATLNKGGGGTTGRREVAEIDVDINIARGEVSTAQEKIDSNTANIAKIDQLEKEEADLEERKREVDREKREKNVELNAARLDVSKKTRTVEDLKSVREGQEQDLVDGVANVFREAARETFEEQASEALRKFEDTAKESKEQATDQRKKNFHRTMETRWQGPEQTRRFLGIGKSKTFRPPDRGTINQDTDLLLRDGDQAYMRSVLTATVNPDTGANYTVDEANALMNDKDFYEPMRKEAITQLLGRKSMFGKLSPEDVFQITHSSWGEGMIQAGFAQNEKFRQALQLTMGEKAVEGHGFFERATREFQRKPWLLALLLGLPIMIGAIGSSATNVEHTG